MAFCGETGLRKEQVEELVKLGILIPLKKNSFNGQDVAIGTLLKACFDQGIHPDELSFYPKLLENIVDQELKLAGKYAKGISMTPI